MRFLIVSTTALAICLGGALLGGCDEETVTEKKVDVKDDGTVVKEQTTVTEKADGTVIEEKTKDVDRPGDDDKVDDDDGGDAKIKVDVDRND